MTAATNRPSRGARIELNGVGKVFPDGTRALEPQDLTVERGETLVLLGPSGCGKTTLLRLIAGLEAPDAGGRILFDGDDVTTLPIEKREVGMVFQSYALFPNMKVIDNVAYSLRVRGIGRDERRERARDMLRLCRIEQLAERSVTDLSGGQRQRVALARAMTAKPRVLLLDEPLTALDANLRDTLRSEIDRLLRSLSITAIYVTHDQTEAMMLGDRVAVLRNGAIAQIGEPRAIYDRPQSPFVAEFVGINNCIEGEVEDGIFRCHQGRMPVGPETPSGAVTIRFRPEHGRIHDPEPTGLAFRIGSVSYTGASQIVLLDRDDGEPLRILAQADTPLRIGDRVGLTVPAERIAIFP